MTSFSSRVLQLSAEEKGKQDFSATILAAIHQSQRLTQLVNQSLTTDAVIPPVVSPTPSPTSPSPADHHTADKSEHRARSTSRSDVMLAVPQKELQTISSKLGDQMSQLLVSADVTLADVMRLMCMTTRLL